MADRLGTVDFNTTIAALQQDLTAIPADDAYVIIEAWQRQLQGTDIVEDLEQLKQAITNGDTDVIAQTLSDLGEDTTEAASDATTNTTAAAQAQRMAELLSQAGSL